MKPVRVAQIGSSHDHAICAFDTILELKDYFDVVGFAETDDTIRVPDTYNRVPRFTVEELLSMDDLEAVVIECAELQATEIAQKFADKGVGVYMDKPGSPNLASFEKLIHTLKEKKLPFMTGYMYRYNPSVKEMMRLVKEGEMGEIYSVEAHMSVRHKNEKRKWLGAFPGGMTFFLGCHLIDLVLQLQGEPEEIIPLNASTGIEGVNTEDFGFVVFRYPHGASFIKTCAAEPNGYSRRQLVVCGSKGTFEIKPFEQKAQGQYMISSPATVALVKENPGHGWHDFARPVETGDHHRYKNMMIRFAQAVRDGDNPYSYDYELLLMKTLLMCCNSGK
ncbi:MAG: Gfo/Idh/MocA family oxidoreductase [Clostridiales bacterium]|nr:Gfo/Idh/MocA family oxidoreductase [Clostridiales bacterium]